MFVRVNIYGIHFVYWEEIGSKLSYGSFWSKKEVMIGEIEVKIEWEEMDSWVCFKVIYDLFEL